MVSYWRLWIVHDQCVWHRCHKTAELDFNDNVMSNIRLPVQQTVELRSLELNNRGVIRSDCMHGHRWHMHPLAVIPSVMFLIQGKYDACICIVGHLGMIVTVGMPRKENDWLLLLEELLMNVCFLYCVVMNVMMQLVLTELVHFIFMKLVILDNGGYIIEMFSHVWLLMTGSFILLSNYFYWKITKTACLIKKNIFNSLICHRLESFLSVIKRINDLKKVN